MDRLPGAWRQLRARKPAFEGLGSWLQLFNKGMLVHTPGQATAQLRNLTELLLAAGRGPTMIERGLPGVEVGAPDDATGLSWLSADPAIRNSFAPDGNLSAGIARYGVPISVVRPAGPISTLMTQRVSIQHYVTNDFGPAGTSVLIGQGDWYNEWGMLRPDAGAQDNISDGTVAPAESTQEIVVQKPRELFGDPEFPGGGLGPDRRFGGVLTSDLLIYGELENVTDLNVAWTREQYQWNNMTRFDQNQFDLTATDRNDRTGLEQVGLAFRTPNYANGGQGNQVPPAGLNLPWNDANNHWGWFLHHLANSRMPTTSAEN